MFKIVETKNLTADTCYFKVAAPDIAKKAQAGQFIILRIDEEGERIPLTIADYDREKGTLTIIFQQIGKTTKQLARLKKGDSLSDVIGPLGHPSEVKNFGTVVFVAGGIGAAPIFPIARTLKEAGNEVITILGARSSDLIIYEDELRSVSDEVRITTDDGSKGHHGLVTDVLKEILSSDKKVDLVFAIGPAIMMKFVCKTTEPFKVKTLVSLNPIMVDGTGMCGACRVAIGNDTKFCCVDGPDFDGHQVDFDLLMARQRQYLDEEKEAVSFYEKEKSEGRI
ncbi:MAG: sulfide/dihydroorotate dehydrogenase-like FAD/NAD-binding protein [Actinobacteria bacterium]|nr:sulfide/dihydroorotate dehydrogenase-like FAD/NAD-binding protein [Actinomycetota bacterium]